MSKYLLQKFQTNKWIPETFSSEEDHLGLLIRQYRGSYVTQPQSISLSLLAAVQKLNVEVAFTMVSEITSSIIEGLEPGQEDLYLPQDHSQYQIVDSLDAIASAPSGRIRKFQYVCIVRKEKLVLLWHDSVEAMVPHVQDVEAKLLALVSANQPLSYFWSLSLIRWLAYLVQIWGNAIPNLLNPGGSKTPKDVSLYSSRNVSQTKLPVGKPPTSGPPGPPSEAAAQVPAEAALSSQRDVEKADRESMDRPLVFISAMYIGMAIALVIILLWGFSVRTLLVEALVDEFYTRFALVSPKCIYILISLARLMNGIVVN